MLSKVSDEAPFCFDLLASAIGMMVKEENEPALIAGDKVDISKRGRNQLAASVVQAVFLLKPAGQGRGIQEGFRCGKAVMSLDEVF
jgi:hypothetical protein